MEKRRNILPILFITEENTAVITYAAFDSSGNASEATRTLKYTDYEAPVFGQKGSLPFRENTFPEVPGNLQRCIYGQICGKHISYARLNDVAEG